MDLHERISNLVKTERKITHQILTLINEAEATKLHLRRGHGSMFEYLTKSLGYSEGSANRRLQSARLLKSIPNLNESLKSGDVNLSQAALMQSAICQQQKVGPVSCEQKELLLKNLHGKTQVQTKKLILESLPDVKFKTERIVLKSEGQNKIVFEVTKEELELIEKTKALLSFSCPDRSEKTVFLKLCEKLVNEKTSPRLTQTRKSSGSKLGRTAKAREPISAKLRRDVFFKSDHQCEFVSSITSQRCGAKSFLEVDHIKPVAFGGTSAPDNLRVLCRSHNQLAAEDAGLLK